MNLKSRKILRYWSKPHKEIDYTQIDKDIIKEFQGSHPAVIQNFFPEEAAVFQADPSYRLSKKEKKHRIMLLFEKWFGLETSKKHYKEIL